MMLLPDGILRYTIESGEDSHYGCFRLAYRSAARWRGRGGRIFKRGKPAGPEGAADHPRPRDRRAAGDGAQGPGADAVRAFLRRRPGGSGRLGSNGRNAEVALPLRFDGIENVAAQIHP